MNVLNCDDRMNFGSRQQWVMGVIVTLMMQGVLAKDMDAEFAIRWNPNDGGPKSASDAVKQLGITEEEKDEYSVRYFTITPPTDLPAGFTLITRQRQNGGKNQLMIKYRSDNPLPDTINAKTWQCPLGSSAENKYEVDISFVKKDNAKRSYSLSCSQKARDFPKTLGAIQRGCDNRMVRLKSAELKIEEWVLQPGDRRLIEVSMSGRDTQNDFDKFSMIADKLIGLGIKPTEGSKSEAGSGSELQDCVRSWQPADGKSSSTGG